MPYYFYIRNRFQYPTKKTRSNYPGKPKFELSIQLSIQSQTPLNKKFFQFPEISGFCFSGNSSIFKTSPYPVQYPKSPVWEPDLTIETLLILWLIPAGYFYIVKLKSPFPDKTIITEPEIITKPRQTGFFFNPHTRFPVQLPKMPV